MATVFRKANSKIWYAQFYDPFTGRRVGKSTGKEKRREAEKVAADYEAAERKRFADENISKPLAQILEMAAREAEAGGLTAARAEEFLTRIRKKADPNFRVVSFSAHVMGWINDQLPHVGTSAARCYRLAHTRITEALGRAAEMPVGEVTESHLKAAFAKVKNSGLRAASVNMDIRIIRRALHRAVSEGLASANAAAGIRVYAETDSTEKAPFTAEEVRALIDSAPDEEWRGLILIAAHTGLRMGDVLSLTRANVDGFKIVIRPQKTARTRKSISIPLTPPCISWIADKEGAFFPRLSKLQTGTVSTTFDRLREKAGVPKTVTLPGGSTGSRSFHSLRHSFASWLAESDVHADVRQKLTGHSSSKIHGRYTHHDESLDRAIKTLPSL